MSTTQEFNADVRGNGFPFCPSRLADDVVPVDGVLPLSVSDYNSQYGAEFGFLSTAENFSGPIDKNDFLKIMPVFWNLESLDVTASASWTFPDSDPPGPDSSSISDETLDQVNEKKPNQRVCGGFSQLYFRFPDPFPSSGQRASFRFSRIFWQAAEEKYYVTTVGQQTFINTGPGENSSAPVVIRGRRFEDIDNDLELDSGSLMIGIIPFWWGLYKSSSSVDVTGSASLSLTPNYYTYD
jgi:hypothetical protein